MFLSRKVKLVNNVRHRRELLWSSFLLQSKNSFFKKLNYRTFLDYKLSLYCVKGFVVNRKNKKIYTTLTDYANGTALTPNKYGLEIGYIGMNHYYSFLTGKYAQYSNVIHTSLIFCDPGSIVYFLKGRFTNSIFAASSGVFITVLKQFTTTFTTQIKLPSGKCKLVSSLSDVYFGRGGNIYAKYVVWGSWGFKYRNKNHRPVVRGIAMNPVDHPNGGRSKIKKPFKNKYNKIAKKHK